MNTKELIESAMSELSNISAGGVGPDGATREELDECNEQGKPCEDNTDYHQGQSAWLYLNEALKTLEDKP